jgi:hypothetical protein
LSPIGSDSISGPSISGNGLPSEALEPASWAKSKVMKASVGNDSPIGSESAAGNKTPPTGSAMTAGNIVMSMSLICITSFLCLSRVMRMDG